MQGDQLLELNSPTGLGPLRVESLRDVAPELQFQTVCTADLEMLAGYPGDFSPSEQLSLLLCFVFFVQDSFPKVTT